MNTDLRVATDLRPRCKNGRRPTLRVSLVRTYRVASPRATLLATLIRPRARGPHGSRAVLGKAFHEIQKGFYHPCVILGHEAAFQLSKSVTAERRPLPRPSPTPTRSSTLASTTGALISCRIGAPAYYNLNNATLSLSAYDPPPLEAAMHRRNLLVFVPVPVTKLHEAR
ncbi:hypothetical protein K438DRAFT_1983214 [Mycena galopus ATCC 62051]|nr:hypothetical protein K438DRAFT_1983214 [Mycena galopus ATCC 62051]